MNRRLRLLSVTSIVVLAACGSAPVTSDDAAVPLDVPFTPIDAGAPIDARSTSPDARSTSPDAAMSPPTDAPVTRSYTIPERGTYRFACDLPVPAGTDAPLPLPTYAGTCPMLVNTTVGGSPGRNMLMSGGDARGFILVAPATPGPEERLPVVFLWHHMGSEADTFLQMDYLAMAVEEFRFIAVLAESLDDLELSVPGVGSIPWEWPWRVMDPAARVTKELQFFDDMLACVAAQYAVNEQCVSTGGVSAGGLWQSHLARGRARRLAAVMSLSGGVDQASSFGDFLGFEVGPWESTEHRMPFLVVWGGGSDVCAGLNFQNASRNLVDGLAADGHALVECTHNCGHSAPPFDPAAPFFQLMDFVLNHPYWLADGDSPYLWYGELPASYEDWCGIGPGSATVRTGMCTGAMPCPL